MGNGQGDYSDYDEDEDDLNGDMWETGGCQNMNRIGART